MLKIWSFSKLIRLIDLFTFANYFTVLWALLLSCAKASLLAFSIKYFSPSFLLASTISYLVSSLLSFSSLFFCSSILLHLKFSVLIFFMLTSLSLNFSIHSAASKPDKDLVNSYNNSIFYLKFIFLLTT